MRRFGGLFLDYRRVVVVVKARRFALLFFALKSI